MQREVKQNKKLYLKFGNPRFKIGRYTHDTFLELFTNINHETMPYFDLKTADWNIFFVSMLGYVAPVYGPMHTPHTFITHSIKQKYS